MAAPGGRVVAEKHFERRVSAGSAAVITELRRELSEYARAIGAPPETCESVALATSEALTNVVLHAYHGQEPGEIIVEAFDGESDQLHVLICDEGVGLRPRADSPGLGIGIAVMAQMADEFSITNRQDTQGTIVSLRFSLDRLSAPSAR